MTSIGTLEHKVRDCIDPFDRFAAVVEPPTDGSDSTEVLGVEQWLESTAGTLQHYRPEVERRSNDFDFKVSNNFIQEGIRSFLGQVETGQHEAGLSKSALNAHSNAVTTHVSGRGRAFHRDGVAPPRAASPLDLRQLPGGLTYCLSEIDMAVAGAANHRLQNLDHEGRFKFEFVLVGKSDGQPFIPSRVTVARATGSITVTAGSPSHQSQVYSKRGESERKFIFLEPQHPRDVAVDALGRTAVSEGRVMRVVIFDQYGNLVRKFVCSDQLNFPNGVVVARKEEIFFSDNLAHCVKVFSYTSVYLRQIGGEGGTRFPASHRGVPPWNGRGGGGDQPPGFQDHGVYSLQRAAESVLTEHQARPLLQRALE